jgi:hypothetical protein
MRQCFRVGPAVSGRFRYVEASGLAAMLLVGCASDHGGAHPSDAGSQAGSSAYDDEGGAAGQDVGGAASETGGRTGNGGSGVGGSATGGSPRGGRGSGGSGTGGSHTGGSHTGGRGGLGSGGSRVGGTGGSDTAGADAAGSGARGSDTGGVDAGGTSGLDTGGTGTGGTNTGGSDTGGTGGTDDGWLHTAPEDPHIYTADDEVWMGRGVNIDDIFLGGYNCNYWMGSEAEAALLDTVAVLLETWKPNFVRVSLAMSSYYQSPECEGAVLANWTDPVASNPYKASMTKVIDALTRGGAYVLVTVRTDETMVRSAGEGSSETCDCTGSCDSATCVPTAETDEVYRALVDSFWENPRVMFGITNEGGGFSPDPSELRDLMSHAVDVIREQEVLRGSAEHLIAVQSTGYTATSSDYASNPLGQTNVVYEHHGYPPEDFVFSNIPIIIGEYGPTDWTGEDTSSLRGITDAFEADQVPNLAWIFEPMNGVTPPLVSGWSGNDRTEANLETTAFGDLVKSYLLAHAE